MIVHYSHGECKMCIYLKIYAAASEKSTNFSSRASAEIAETRPTSVEQKHRNLKRPCESKKKKKQQINKGRNVVNVNIVTFLLNKRQKSKLHDEHLIQCI